MSGPTELLFVPSPLARVYITISFGLEPTGSVGAVALKDNTIPHEVIGEFGGGRVLLRPASPA